MRTTVTVNFMHQIWLGYGAVIWPTTNPDIAVQKVFFRCD